MDIKKFQLFADIAETKNISKSAERLHYSQSGVSHMLKNLEVELGFQLFIRQKQGVVLTEAGKHLLPAVNELLHCSENVNQIIGELNHVQCGTVVVGCYTSIASSWLPSILKRFSAEFPDIHIQLREGNTEELENMLSDGSIEFAFLSYRDQPQYRWIPMADDELVTVMAADDPLASIPVFPADRLAEVPFIMPGGIGTEFTIRHLLSPGISLHTTLSSMDDHAIISMVRSGLGYSLLPRLVLADHSEGIAAVPTQPTSSRTLGIATLPDYELTPAAKKFIACALDLYCEEPYRDQISGWL